jgi:hypothetical protein
MAVELMDWVTLRLEEVLVKKKEGSLLMWGK